MGQSLGEATENNPQTNTLFQQTAARVQGAGMHPPLVICAEQHRFFVLEQLARLGIKPAAVILEPTPRSTAPAIALAALWANENGITDPLSLLPADHLMGSPTEFQQALKAAAPTAQSHIVLFGITPTFAHTEYGYIQHGKTHSNGIYHVTKFHEKPNRQRAEDMLKEGGYSWNSGMFTAIAQVLSAELQTHAANVWQGTQTAWNEKTAENLLGTTLIRPGSSFAQIPAEPFDTAVMERTAKAVVMPYQGRWSDIGTFSTLAEALPQDDAGNSLVGADILAQESDNTLVHSSTAGKVVAVSGLSGVVVIDTPDALLVTTKAKAASVKNVFNALQKQGATQANDPARIHRPWGWYETISKGPGYLVKRIGVVPGGRLSLQYHHFRAEHWVVVTGTATVTNGEKTMELNPDQSTYIPLGAHHRLENKTDKMVEIIEVQTGTKLVESDIVRLDDVYNRAGTNT